MNVATKFSLGDIVYAVGLITSEERKTCPTCEGGLQVVHDEQDRNVTYCAVEIKGRLFVCPDCKGDGEKRRRDQRYGLHAGRVTEVKFSQEEGRTPVITYRLGNGYVNNNTFREDQCYGAKRDAEARARASNNFRKQRQGGT